MRLPVRSAIVCSLALSALSVAGCGPTSGEQNWSLDTSSETGPDAGVDADGDTKSVDATRDTGPDLSTEDYPLATCDELEPFRCALPWPSNLYLAPDADRTTGYQLRFGDETLPKARGVDHIDPKPYRRLDGYGLGTPIMVHFPKVDTSRMATRFDIESSVAKDAPIVLLEVQEDGSTERVPYWAELDARADDEPKEQLLMVRPAVILEENTRYVVAFRNLLTKGGARIEASEAFAKLREGDVSAGSTLARRRSRFEEVFGILSEAGVDRESLTLAWDFRTASADGLRGRMQKMRRTAFQEVGEKGPKLDFDSEDVEVYGKPGSGASEIDPEIGLAISGTFDAPHFMEKVSDDRKWAFHLDEEGRVRQNGTRDAEFLMHVPHEALDGKPAGVVLYGHGLLGNRKSIKAGIWKEMANEYNYIFIAGDWTGMSREDVNTAISASSDITNFQGIADRMHQGILEFLLLARAAKRRVPELDALNNRGVTVDTDHVYYVGASQGGIYGQTFMALTKTITRGFLGVPGNNYSTLLKRSVNFDRFLGIMESYYDTAATRNICIGAMQLLWSGTDPVSYAPHIEQDPIVSGVSDKDVLLTPSKGDHQVAVVTNEVLARTKVGIPLMENYDDMHDPWDTPTASYPHDESGTILFDYGDPWPKRRNRPPKESGGDDPHDNLEQVDRAGELIDTFLRDEKIIDICGSGPCDF